MDAPPRQDALGEVVDRRAVEGRRGVRGPTLYCGSSFLRLSSMSRASSGLMAAMESTGKAALRCCFAKFGLNTCAMRQASYMVARLYLRRPARAGDARLEVGEARRKRVADRDALLHVAHVEHGLAILAGGHGADLA